MCSDDVRALSASRDGRAQPLQARASRSEPVLDFPCCCLRAAPSAESAAASCKHAFIPHLPAPGGLLALGVVHSELRRRVEASKIHQVQRKVRHGRSLRACEARAPINNCGAGLRRAGWLIAFEETGAVSGLMWSAERLAGRRDSKCHARRAAAGPRSSDGGRGVPARQRPKRMLNFRY